MEQKFGVHNQKKSDNENNYSDKKSVNRQGIILIIIIAVIFAKVLFTGNKSVVLYCDKTQDFCELQTVSYIGSPKKTTLYPPSNIKHAISETDYTKAIISDVDTLLSGKKKSKYVYVRLYLVNKDDQKTEIYHTSQDMTKSTEYNRKHLAGRRTATDKKAKQINELLQSGNNIIEYKIK